MHTSAVDKTSPNILPSRDIGIDIARATYIAMMILYHCFVQAQAATSEAAIDINRYLILVSGSFPFLAGFLISNHYFIEIFSGHKDTKRLAVRGFKLLSLYFFINIFLLAFAPILLPDGVVAPSNNIIDSILFVRPSEVVYDILAPLGLILIIGSLLGLLYTNNVLRNAAQIQIICIVAAVAFAVDGTHPYIACGILGIGIGFSRSDLAIDSYLAKSPPLGLPLVIFGLGLATLSEIPRSTGIFYLTAVACLFYALRSVGGRHFHPRATHIQNEINMFSQYSLLIYLVHVPVLVILTKLVMPIMPQSDTWPVFIAFTIFIFASMSLMIRAVSLLRKKLPLFDNAYRLVFA